MLALLFGAVPCTYASTDIVLFFGGAKRAEYGMRQGLVQLRQQDAEAAAAAEGSLRLLDHQVAADRLGSVFDQFLAKTDKEAIRAFMPTSAGIAVGAAFQTHMDPRELQAALNAIRGADRAAAAAFMNGPEVEKMMAALRSPAAKQAMSAYGEELMCVYLAKANRSAFANAQRKGKCEGIK
jgi:hypothetical protein